MPALDQNYDYAIEQAAQTHEVPKALLRSLSNNNVNRSLSYSEIVSQINSIADNLSSAVALTGTTKAVRDYNVSAGYSDIKMTNDEYTDALLKSYFRIVKESTDPAVYGADYQQAKDNFVKDISIGDKQVSLWDFVKNKLNLRTFLFIIIAAFLFFVGVSGLIKPTIQTAKGSVS